MRFVHVYRRILRFLATTALFALFGNVVLQVLSRSFLVRVPIWTEEVGSYLLVWLVALSAGLLFLEKEPIGIDFLVKRLPEPWQKVVTFFNLTLSAWFAMMLIYGSLTLVQRGAFIRTPALNLPYSFVYSGLTVTGAVILMTLLVRLVGMISISLVNRQVRKGERNL